MTRAGWVVRTGFAVIAAIAVTTLVVAVAIGLAAVGQGADATTPALGIWVLGLYAAAVAGIGIAVGGLVRLSLGAAVAVAVVVGSYLLEFIGSALRLPDQVMALSLNHHLGQPMAGSFDPIGIVICAALALGGVLVGAWGLARRDLHG
jgi:ABC-2 type transport system permease protein